MYYSKKTNIFLLGFGQFLKKQNFRNYVFKFSFDIICFALFIYSTVQGFLLLLFKCLLTISFPKL